MMKFILYSAFLLLLAPCNASKKAASSDAAKPEESKPETVLITYQKTVCFGACPAFTMTIDGKKMKASYKGDSHVDKLGDYERTISEAELSALTTAFEKYKFFDMQDEYTSEITDIPSRYVGYTLNEKTKKIKDRYNAPAELKEIEKLLDAIADSEGWVKVNTADQ